MKGNGRVLAALSIGHGGVHWYGMAFAVILALIKDEFNLTFAQAGLILSVITAGGFIVNLPSGAISDMGRKRTLMTVSLLAGALGYLAVSLAPVYGVVLLCVSLLGFGGALWHPPAMSTLSDRFPGRRGFALAMHEFGANLGDFLGPAVTGIVLVVLLWRQVAALYVSIGVVLALLVWLVAHDGGQVGKKVMLLSQWRSSLAGLLSNPPLIQVSGVSALRSMGQQALHFFLPLYLFSTLALGPGLTGIYTSMLTFPALFAGPVMGTLSDRAGRKPVLVGGLGLAGVLTLLLALSRPAAEVSSYSSLGLGGTLAAILAVFRAGDLFLIALVALGLFLFSMRPIIFAYAMDVTPPELGATTVGFVFTTNQALSMASPFIAGLIADLVGPPYVFLYAGGLIIGSSLVAALLPAPRRQEAAIPQAR